MSSSTRLCDNFNLTQLQTLAKLIGLTSINNTSVDLVSKEMICSELARILERNGEDNTNQRTCLLVGNVNRHKNYLEGEDVNLFEGGISYGSQRVYEIGVQYTLSFYSKAENYPADFDTLLDQVSRLRNLIGLGQLAEIPADEDVLRFLQNIEWPDVYEYPNVDFMENYGCRRDDDSVTSINSGRYGLFTERYPGERTTSYISYANNADGEEIKLNSLSKSKRKSWIVEIAHTPVDNFDIILKDCRNLYTLINLPDEEDIRNSPLFKRIPKYDGTFEPGQLKIKLIGMLCYLIAEAMFFDRGSASINELLISIILIRNGFDYMICSYEDEDISLCSVDLEIIYAENMTSFVETTFKSFLCDIPANYLIDPPIEVNNDVRISCNPPDDDDY